MTRLIDADALKDDILKSAVMIDDRGIQTGYEIAIELIKRQPTIDIEPQWIPCSEMLPKDDRSKVVTLANGNTEVGYYSNGDWWCIGDSFRLENPTVIAWMPLPKPYEVKE